MTTKFTSKVSRQGRVIRINREALAQAIKGDREALVEALDWPASLEGLSYWHDIYFTKARVPAEAREKLRAYLPLRRGFNAMSKSLHQEISRKGGLATPAEKRPFSLDRAHARACAKRGRAKQLGRIEA